MKSLKGYALKQIIKAENGETRSIIHRIQGNSFIIGSSFLSHLVVKACKDIHTVISLNDANQVEIRNYSAMHPVCVNGQPVVDPQLLRCGDTLKIMEHTFVWENQEQENSEDETEAPWDASYQNDNPVDKERCKSEPRVVNHKWVVQRKNNKSIHIGEVSSTTEDDGEVLESTVLEEKENVRPASDSEGECDPDGEKTILNELNENSRAAEVTSLIDLNTPEPPHKKSINLIELATPAPSKVHTPMRATPVATGSKLLKKILDPRISLSVVESDFDKLSENIHSTPMVDRSQGSLIQQTTVIEISGINESTELAMETCSDQSTIVSKSVRENCAIVSTETEEVNDQLMDEIPETQPESEMEDLFEDAQELTQSLVKPEVIDDPTKASTVLDDYEEDDDEVIPATQMENILSPTENVNFCLTIDEEDLLESPAGTDKQDAELSIVPENVEDSAEGELPLPEDVQPPTEDQEEEKEMEQQNDSPVKVSRAFTPRKSMRTPKKLDPDHCCTPKSLSKVLLAESATRKSPRLSRMNLSLRMDKPLPKTPKNLSKSLMVSKLKSATKSAMKASNKSVVEILESASEDEEEEDDDDGVVLLADDTIVESPALGENRPETPIRLEISVGNDSDLIIIGSQEALSAVLPMEEDANVQVKEELGEPEPSTIDESPAEIVDQKEESLNVVEETPEKSIVNDLIEEVLDNVSIAMEEKAEIAVNSTTIIEEQVNDEPIGADSTIDHPTIEEPQDDLSIVIEEKSIRESIVSDPASQEIIPETPLPKMIVRDAQEDDEMGQQMTEEELLKSPTRIPISTEGTDSPKTSSSLQKTPKAKIVSDDRITRSPLQNVSNMVGIRELFKTPKGEPEKNFTGLKEMMKTPAPPTTVYTATEMVGLREMMKTPGRLFTDPSLVGVKELMKTPKAKPENENFIGIKEMVNTPVPQKDAALFGVREMMQTPKNREAQMLGVKELMNTPAPAVNVNTVGMKELFNTPQVTRDVNMVGVKELMNTPAPIANVNMVGVKELLKTPAVEKKHNLEAADGMAEIFKTPAPIKNTKRVLDLLEDDTESLGLIVEDEEVPVAKSESTEEEPSIIAKVNIEFTEDETLKENISECEKSEEVVDEKLAEKLIQSSEAKEVISMMDEESPSTSSSDEPKVEEEEEVKFNTSEELFDKMMDRKPIRNTYSRLTPAKEKKVAMEEIISPEKKVEVERWVESIIVTGNEETLAKKPINNNLQILSDRYSNVTPSQGQKAESILKLKGEISVPEEVETIEETQAVEKVEEEDKPEEVSEQPTQPMEAEKSVRGRRVLNRAMAVEEPVTPKRTRRNIKLDLEDTPTAVTTPRTRRAAVMKLDESAKEVKVTPGRRGRKPKTAVASEVEEKTEEIELIAKEKPVAVEEPIVPVKEEEVTSTESTVEETDKQSEEEPTKGTTRTRGRPKVVKTLITEDKEVASPKATPSKRGRKPKVVELSTESEMKPATPTRRGRKAAVAKSVVEEEEKPADAEVKEVATEDVAQEMIPKEEEKTKPAGRGRGRKAAAKVEEGSQIKTVTESEDSPNEEKTKVAVKSTRTGRKAAKPQDPTTDTDDSPKKEVTEKPRRGRATTKKVEDPKAKEVESSPPVENEKLEETVDEIMVKKPTRGRKAAIVAHELVNDSVASTPGRAKRGARKATVTDEEESKVVEAPAPKRGRPKRGATTESVDVAESPKRAKTQESETDEGQRMEEKVEEKPKRGRGRAKLTATLTEDLEKMTDSEVNESVTTSKGRGRKAKEVTAVPVEPEKKEDTAESEKETNSDEVSSAPAKSRAKRTATKRAATQEEPEETVRKTSRVTRRRN